MDARRHERISEIYAAASELAAGARTAFLERACAGDRDLQAEVESLLALEQEALHALPLEPVAVHPERIGRYRVLGVLGEGGMGVVYKAEQDQPQRTVALKVMRFGFASPDLQRRFQFEVAVLGRLQHPGIAQIFAAGTIGTQPFFAMELVDGQPLPEYVRTMRPSRRARIELVIAIADAVHHAHLKGIVHRDLKPDNILVDARGQPKILDFGIAKATDADLGAATGMTQVGQVIGTLGYMSPEQAAGSADAIDSRSDVYSLGVILYELLAERLPYPIQGEPMPQALRLILEHEPAPLGEIDRRLRGDLQTIVSKALEKDPDRRYRSATDLADDLVRSSRDEPIQARCPGA